MSTFSYGQKRDPFYIVLTTSKFTQPQEIDLDDALEAALADLEKGGAKNMLVKREEFETEKGIKGMRAYEEFYQQFQFRLRLHLKVSQLHYPIP